MNIFWKNPYLNYTKTYHDFLLDLQKESLNNSYIQEKDPYKVFLCLIKNALNNKKTILLDADLSNTELDEIGLNEKEIQKLAYKQEDLTSKLSSFKTIFAQLDQEKENLIIEIYTSGTTGRPKKIAQTLKNVIRHVKQTEKCHDNVWAFAYNPTHFAGLQVFFQAFFNLNSIIYIFDKDWKLNYNEIKNFNVTNLSCTPTYMKMLLPYVKEKNTTIKNLTFGGERFDVKIENIITEMFPKARINNVYASSEAGSLLSSSGEGFTIPNRYSNNIKISEENELLVNQSFLGHSKSLELNNGWYYTGDLVEYLDKEKTTFVFKNRKTDFVNIGGYKVNPNEIESIIKKIDNVEDAVVFGRKNSVLGNVIVAQVILLVEEDKREKKKQILNILKENLQDWKIPQLIKFVNNFELTRTGKVKK